MKHERFLKVIKAPHLSEKATVAAQDRNEYVFEVGSSATKPQIKAAVEYLFKAKVKSVRVINVKTKPKRFGSIEGRSKAWKKAYVKLHADYKIDFAGAQ
jgi:large subunit ribosomal protein L23